MDRLEAMSIVLTAVETGSLSAAARQLNTPLATVSRKVTELEKHLQTNISCSIDQRASWSSLTRAFLDFAAPRLKAHMALRM